MCDNLYVCLYATAFSMDFTSINITYYEKQSSIYRTLVFKVATTGTKGRTLKSCIVYFCHLEVGKGAKVRNRYN